MESNQQKEGKQSINQIPVIRGVVPLDVDYIHIETAEERVNAAAIRMKKAIMKQEIMTAVVAGAEAQELIKPDGTTETLVCAIAYTEDHVKVVIDGNDFFRYSSTSQELVLSASGETEEKLKKQQKVISWAIGLPILFVPQEIYLDQDTALPPMVLGSRKQAAKALRKKHFFSKATRDVYRGSVVPAVVLNVSPEYVIVDVFGCAVTMVSSQLGAFRYVENCRDYFRVGQGFEVVVLKADVDRENDQIDLMVSLTHLELATVAPSCMELVQVGGFYTGTVFSVGNSGCSVCCEEAKFRCYVANSYINIEGGVVPGDRVVVKVRSKKDDVLAFGSISAVSLGL